MDVDNDPVDQNLLLQFTCLGTTDRDDLIKQFKELIDKVNDTTAAFFLEMNNWNLQNAICSFLDYGSHVNLPLMSVLESCSQLFLEHPNSRCVMWWTIRNDGTEPWPDFCSLQYTSGNHHCETKSVRVSHTVYPNLSTTMVVYFSAPSQPGWYHSTWRMVTASGVYFGEVLTLTFQVQAEVEDPLETSLSEELASRMALVDRTEMEEELNAESSSTNANILPNSAEFDKKNMQDQEDQTDQEIS